MLRRVAIRKRREEVVREVRQFVREQDNGVEEAEEEQRKRGRGLFGVGQGHWILYRVTSALQKGGKVNARTLGSTGIYVRGVNSGITAAASVSATSFAFRSGPSDASCSGQVYVANGKMSR